MGKSNKPRRKTQTAADARNGQPGQERDAPIAEAAARKARLDLEDLYLLELHNTRSAWENTKRQLAEAKAQLREQHALLEIRALRQAAEEHERQSRKHKRDAVAFVVQLTEKYGLQGKSWGYEDHSGTITVEEPEIQNGAESGRA